MKHRKERRRFKRGLFFFASLASLLVNPGHIAPTTAATLDSAVDAGASTKPPTSDSMRANFLSVFRGVPAPDEAWLEGEEQLACRLGFDLNGAMQPVNVAELGCDGDKAVDLSRYLDALRFREAGPQTRYADGDIYKGVVMEIKLEAPDFRPQAVTLAAWKRNIASLQTPSGECEKDLGVCRDEILPVVEDLKVSDVIAANDILGVYRVVDSKCFVSMDVTERRSELRGNLGVLPQVLWYAVSKRLDEFTALTSQPQTSQLLAWNLETDRERLQVAQKGLTERTASMGADIVAVVNENKCGGAMRVHAVRFAQLLASFESDAVSIARAIPDLASHDLLNEFAAVTREK